MPLDLLHTRYTAFGGIARSLIKLPLPGGRDGVIKTIEERQHQALVDISEKPSRIDGGELASGYKHLWSLYHLQPTFNADGTPNFYDYTIELCCDDARIRIRDILMRKSVTELWELYINTMARHGTLRGIRYEAYAHKKIQVDGLNGQATSLTTGG